MIQDIVFALGGLVFLASLVPTLRNPRAAVPLGTSLPTGLILIAFSGAQASLGLTMAAVTSITTGMAWLAVAAYRRPSFAKGIHRARDLDGVIDGLHDYAEELERENEALLLAYKMAKAAPGTIKVVMPYEPYDR